MNILVCISNVPDTTTKIRFKENQTKFEDGGVQWIINPWDELALTRALELKEKSGGKIGKITVVTVGEQAVEPTLRKALAVGADNAIRIDAPPSDAYFVAAQLAEATKTEEYQIILCGIESSDHNGSAVGGMLSELLNMPSVSSVSSLDMNNDKIILNREIDGGKETIEMNTPLIAVVQKGIALDPRIPAMRGIMMARSKPLSVVPSVDIEALTEVVNYELPAAKTACKMIDAENTDELVSLLANEAKAL
jgi:electron transfer flavoprotein beta subunit